MKRLGVEVHLNRRLRPFEVGALQPDAVLLYFGFNDFLKVAFRERRDSLSDSDSARLTDRQLFAQRQSCIPRPRKAITPCEWWLLRFQGRSCLLEGFGRYL